MWPATLANAGLVILSRHPVDATQYMTFRQQSWFEKFAVSRGALFAKLQLPGDAGHGFFFTTHTTSPSDILVQTLHLERFQTAFTDRNSSGSQQLREFAGFIASNLAAHRDGAGHGRDSLVVVCGDINIKPAHPEFADFTAMMQAQNVTPALDDAWRGRWEATFGLRHPATGAPLETMLTHTPDQRMPPKCLDYFFSNRLPLRAIVDRVAQGNPALASRYQQVSDHAGLSVTLQLRSECTKG